MSAQQLVDTPVQSPNDWPSEGPIDLAIHDLPHNSSTIEWWYVNCHLITEGGRSVSLFAAFFRSVEEYDGQSGEPVHGHALTWAIIESQRMTYPSPFIRLK